LRSTDLRRLAVLLADTATLLEAHAVEVCRRAAADRDDGYPTTNGGRGSGPADPTGTLATRPHPPDRVAAMAATLRADLYPATTIITEIRRNILGLLPISPDEARRLETATRTAATCSICSRVVTGVRDDRLKSSRCPACYEYLRRTGTDRPRSLWHDDHRGQRMNSPE